ncbi:hypothetical protein DVH24_016646 [Malus domestica]|uniref:Uncharacterized protein n=1 Tax=Malus domestica TaxID=3750 RepID=A0A498HU82_MALDO|nr:hypothetical protein DVH24_016646 [Malus domestica]
MAQLRLLCKVISLLSLPFILSLPSPSLSFPYPSSPFCISSNSIAFHLSPHTVKLYLHNPLPIIFPILKSKKHMILFGFCLFCMYESGVRDNEERSSSGVDG